MKLTQQPIETICQEHEIYESLLALDGKEILELGCGNADITRQIATGGRDRRITATEVDQVQHRQNLLIDDLPNVTFIEAGSQAIPAENNRYDLAFMFKSLHHVPTEMMAAAMSELSRVLKPGGMAYISEPVFDGNFNEMLRLFHDEEQVRKAAFEAIKVAVEERRFSLVKQVFFNLPIQFANFSDFADKVINVSHTEHRLSEELLAQVKERFMENRQQDSFKFLQPIRVDLLQKPV